MCSMSFVSFFEISVFSFFKNTFWISCRFCFSFTWLLALKSNVMFFTLIIKFSSSRFCLFFERREREKMNICVNDFKVIFFTVFESTLRVSSFNSLIRKSSIARFICCFIFFFSIFSSCSLWDELVESM